MKVGPILCGVCGKPVDRWVIERDEENMSTVFRVFCHGDEDQMTVSDFDIKSKGDADAMKEAIACGGAAFRTNMIQPE